MDTKQNDIWEMEGQRAYAAGKRLDECPYNNVVAVREWETGWCYARYQQYTPQKPMTNRIHTPSGYVQIDCEPGQVSDGYHTFDELYEHRCLLFAAWCRWMPETFKTRKNDKGEEWPGWFIAGFNTPWGQVTYHLPDSMWDLVDAFEIDRNFGYDGHTSQDVAQRLRKMLEADWV